MKTHKTHIGLSWVLLYIPHFILFCLIIFMHDINQKSNAYNYYKNLLVLQEVLL